MGGDSKASSHQTRSTDSGAASRGVVAMDTSSSRKGSKDEATKSLHGHGEGDDVSDGPMKNRGCTDVWCCGVFLVHWAGFVMVIAIGMANGNPSKLYAPRDYKGDYCGVEENWNSPSNLESTTKLIHMMNLTEFVDSPAKTFVCSSAAEDELRKPGVLTNSQLSDYLCACCKSPCASCQGVLGLDNFDTPASASASVSAKLTDLTDSSRVGFMFSASGPNGGEYNGVFGQATKFFYQVCVTDCSVASNNYTTGGARNYTYSPPPDSSWKIAWDELATNPLVAQSMRDVIAESFIFVALPQSVCPYQAKYCVPLAGTSFQEIATGYCSFQVSQTVLSSIGTASGSLNINSISDAGYDTLGSAMGDVLTSMDTFVIVCVIAFVNGFVFLVLLRFFIGFIVWGSVFGVFVAFVGAGAGMYVRSGQCSGTSFVDTGTNYGISAGAVVDDEINGVVVTSDESITGTGADYRGTQHKTRGGRSCQAWAASSPHDRTLYDDYTSEEQTTLGLVENYCRNPSGAVYIWCYTTDPDVRWELCDPRGVQPWDHSCPNGYAVSDEKTRDILKVFSYLLWGCSLIWLLCLCCLWSRIRLAVALNEVAATFLYHTPNIILVPIIESFVAICWNLMWAFCASFILSQVADGYVPAKAFMTYAEAYGTVDTPGECTGMYPSGYAWKYEGDVLLTDDPCSGNMGDISALQEAGTGPACWKCMPPRFMIDPRFAYAFFTYLWFSAFIIAVGQTIVAGATGVWFFAAHGEKNKVHALRTGWRNVWRYHLGSLALGSFIIAAVQFVRYCLMYLEQQARAQKNRIMVLVFRVLAYIVWCVEKCLKYLTKNAFIQVALVGCNFCSGAKKAFQLIFRNGVRFAVFAMLGGIINMLGICLIVSLTLFMGYYILIAMHDEVSPVVPMIFFALMSYVVAKLFMMVFHLACDTMMSCFILTEEMGLEKAKAFVPKELRKLIPSTE